LLLLLLLAATSAAQREVFKSDAGRQNRARLIDAIMSLNRVRVGLVGYGALGQYLARQIMSQGAPVFELVFVWNRTFSRVSSDPDLAANVPLENLADFQSRKPDLIVEVADPSITAIWGERFLEVADFFVGSPTALADAELNQKMRESSERNHGLYIPSGALWGADDIKKMADGGSLMGLCITMAKHPQCLKLHESLAPKLIESAQKNSAVEVFRGSVRTLCPLAPNNVNTMAAAALAAHTLGFDGVQAVLVADPRLRSHDTTVEVVGSAPGSDSPCRITTTRINPAADGAVTGNATYASFFRSLMRAKGRGLGVHFC
jgi:predicted dinucleotide-utilizing enzyme